MKRVVAFGKYGCDLTLTDNFEVMLCRRVPMNWMTDALEEQKKQEKDFFHLL